MDLGRQNDIRIRPLTTKQRKAIELLVNGYRKQEICRELEISKPTLCRWQQLPAWGLALDEACRVEQDEGEIHVKTLLPLASRALRKLVLTGSESTRLASCRLIYETVDRMVTREEQREVVIELEEQLEELKSLVAQQQAQLPEASGEVIEAEITPIAHVDAHDDPDPAPEAKEEPE